MTADPLAGDPAAVTKLSRALADRQDDLRTGATTVARAADDAADWEGASKDRFSATVGTIAPAAQRIIGRLDAAIDVLGTYADEVQRIQDEAERIRASQLTTAMDSAITALSLSAAKLAVSAKDATDADARQARRLQSDADDLAATASRLDAEWDALVRRRATADRAASAGLSDTEVLGVAPSYSGTLGRMSDADFLAAVAAMPPEVLAAQDPSVADRLAGMPPETVQAWWDGLGGRGTAGEHAAAQDALITALPAVVGNLNGVPYWARDQANRLSAQRAYAQASGALRDAQDKYGKAVGRAAQAAAQRELISAQERYDQLKNFSAGARTQLDLVDQVPRQMITFHDGAPPLGAFSVGDLDTADGVSFLVPGMGSSLADTTQYMRAGANVLATQQQVGADTAIVSWIGYEAPPNAASTGNLGVLGETYADRGASKLASDLVAFRAVRPDAQLNVIAHSYGSTTTALTLARNPDLGVHSFVTLGSAGLPSSVPDAAATHADHMYAAQAAEKGDIAYIGRKYSFPHRLDPADGFDGVTRIDTTGTHRVNIHGLTAGQGSGDRGYLDIGTPTLSDVAEVTQP